MRALLNEDCKTGVIVVDDDSKGGSFELLERMAQQDTCSKVLCHDRNQGKWLALLIGINKASAPIILIHAVDIESDTENYAALLKSILRGKPDAVFGSCFRRFARESRALFLASLGTPFSHAPADHDE